MVMLPSISSVPELLWTLMVGGKLTVTGPVPRLSNELPTYATLLFQVCGMLPRTTGPPLLLSRVPPAIVSMPVPMAELPMMSSVEAAWTVVPPLYVFVPPSVSSPLPTIFKATAPPV